MLRGQGLRRNEATNSWRLLPHHGCKVATKLVSWMTFGLAGFRVLECWVSGLNVQLQNAMLKDFSIS